MENSPRFLSAVAAVFFLAACAYLGAALYEQLEPNPTPEPPAPMRENTHLRGIAVRSERSFRSEGGELGAVTEGGRIPCGFELCAGVCAESSAVFFSETDGYEFLTPERLDGLTVEGLETLLALPPEEKGDFRLVYGRDWYIAALADSPLPAHGRCRFCPDGLSEVYDAEILSSETDGSGNTVVLLRLTAGSEAALQLRQVTGTVIEN